MTDEKKINNFITLLYKETDPYSPRTGDNAIRCALVAFGVDLGILDNGKELDKDIVNSCFPHKNCAASRISGFLVRYSYLGEAEIKDILYRCEYKCVPGVYDSDKEAFIRNLSRIALREDGLDKHLAHRALCNVAKDMGIISEATWKELLNMPLNQNDYYYNIDKLRMCVEFTEKYTQPTVDDNSEAV